MGSKSVTADGTIRLTDIEPDDSGREGDGEDDAGNSGDAKDARDVGGREHDLSGQVPLDAGWEHYQTEHSDDGDGKGRDDDEKGAESDGVDDAADGDSELESDLNGQVSLGDFG